MLRNKYFKAVNYLLIFSHFIIFTAYGQAGTNTEFYCYSNGELYILPLGVTYDCNTAKCMFNYFFNSNRQRIDDNHVYCGQIVTTNSSYHELINPFCPGQNSNSSSKVEIFKDENFTNGEAGGEGVMKYGPGETLSCMNTTPRRNHSFWGEVFGGFFDQGPPVRNDEITSIRVPAGLKITCWIDCNYQGASRVFTEDCANVGNDWNDKISSFKVESNVTTTVKTVNVIKNGTQTVDKTIIYPLGGPLNFDGYPFRLKNELAGTYLNIETDPTGTAKSTVIKPEWASAIWYAKEISPQLNVLKNSWTNGILALGTTPLYLVTNSHPKQDPIFVAKCSSFEWNNPWSQWYFEFVENSTIRCRIKNLFNNTYLTVQDGGILYCEKSPLYLSSIWIIEKK